MQTIEVPQENWTRALDDFSALHDGWLISLDIVSSELGVETEIRDLPLLGVTADADANGSEITVAAARRNGEQITHIIHAPTHVRIKRTNDGADAMLQIDSRDGPVAILRLKTVVSPETVDGIPAR